MMRVITRYSIGALYLSESDTSLCSSELTFLWNLKHILLLMFQFRNTRVLKVDVFLQSKLHLVIL